MLNHLHQIDTIKKSLNQTDRRVIVVDVDGTKVIVKRHEAIRGYPRYHVLKWSSRFFRLPSLMPVSMPGGAAAQDIEIKRLTELTAAGIPVPQLLHVEPDWIAISYEGQHSLSRMIEKGDLAPSVYWEQGLAAILDVHQKGQNLSQIYVRNAMWHEGKVIFIDFEDDPGAILGRTHAQTRDWLFYLYSSAWMLEIQPAEAAKIMFKYVRQDTDEVQDIVFNSLGALKFLRHLPSKRKPWGRDVFAMHRVGKILHEIGILSRMS